MKIFNNAGTSTKQTARQLCEFIRATRSAQNPAQYLTFIYFQLPKAYSHFEVPPYVGSPNLASIFAQIIMYVHKCLHIVKGLN